MASRHQKRHSIFVTLILLLFLFSGEGPLFGQEETQPYRLNKQYVKIFFHDFEQVIISPKEWKTKDVFTLSAILATGTVLFIMEEDIQDWVQENRSTTSDDTSRLLSPLGHGLFLGSSLTVLYVSGEVFDKKSWRKTALLGLEGWVISGIMVNTLKIIIGRARPHTGKGSTDFHPFSLQSSYRSFPSGHASSAFAVATTIAEQSDNFLVDFLAYSLATLTSFTRIHDNEHWASDTFIGAAIGYFVAKKVSSFHRKGSEGKIHVGFQFTPQRQAITLHIFF